MSFIEEYTKWFQQHLKRRKGERKDRLKRGLRHGEQLFLKLVWWPLFGNFDNLHPEYEVLDWRRARFFIDFVLKIGHIKIAIEIKGYGPHVENSDRTKYRRELNRELFLQGLGFQVVSIPYDELEENPELIRTLLKMILNQYLNEDQGLNRIEQELIRLAIQNDRIVRPIWASRELGMDRRTVVKHLRALCDKGKFRAIQAGDSNRVNKYEYIGPL